MRWRWEKAVRLRNTERYVYSQLPKLELRESDLSDQGLYSNYYSVPFSFPQNEFMLINNFGMTMVPAETSRGSSTALGIFRRELSTQ